MYKVPTYQEIRSYLGPSLTDVFLHYCHPTEKKLLGVAVQNGCRKSLRNSIDCVDECIMFHETEKIKACTHQDILDIGKSLLKDFQKEIEEKVENRLENEFVDRELMFEAEKRRAVELSREEKEAEYARHIEALEQEMEEKLKKEIDTVVSKGKKEMQKAVVQERLNTTREILRKMRQEVCYIVASLYEEFDQYNRASREKMIADFNEIRRREHIRLNAKSKEFESKTMEAFREKTNALEMRNIVETCRILCFERSRCNEEKQSLYENFQVQNRVLQDLVVKLYQALRSTKEQLLAIERKKKLLESKLCKIVGEFQKFINISLDATPGQADYLLPLKALCLTIDHLEEDTNENKNSIRSNSIELNESELKFCACIKRTDDWSKASVKSFNTNKSISCCSTAGKRTKK